MIGDGETNLNWVVVLFKKFGSLIYFVAKKVWDYVEHF